VAEERSKVGEGSRRQLGVSHIVKPFGKKGGNIAVVGRCANEDLGVAQPPEALVALGAIGRDAEEVVALAPVDIGKEPIDISVRALEVPGARNVRANYASGYGAFLQFARKPRDFCIPEAVESEPRLEDLLAARGRVGVGLAGCA